MPSKPTTLTIGIIATLATTAAVTATSSATMTLPTFSGSATTGTSAGKTAKLTIKGGASFICTSVQGTSTFNSGSRNLGPGTLKFLECTQGGEACHDLNLGAVSANTIEGTGEWHLVLFVKGGIDGHYYLFLLPSFGLHVECPDSLVKLLVYTGSVLGSITQKAGSTTAFTVKVTASGTTQEFSEYENDAGTAVKTKLETSQEAGAPKESFWNIEEGSLTFGSATSIEN